jgi:hypothetical protein
VARGIRGKCEGNEAAAAWCSLEDSPVDCVAQLGVHACSGREGFKGERAFDAAQEGAPMARALDARTKRSTKKPEG